MSLREMPSTFTCDGCYARLPLDLLCAARPDWIACMRCCACPEHGLVDDPGGTVVLDFRARHPWRGLDGSAPRPRSLPRT